MAVKSPTSDHEEILSWAQLNAAVPAEVLPAIVDSIPPLIQLMRKEQATKRRDMRIISWEDFFAKFDALGLSLVYDDDLTGYNEILEREELSAFRHADHRSGRLEN